MNTPSKAEARVARELSKIIYGTDERWEECVPYAPKLIAAATLPPQDSSGDARELVKRLVPLASAKRDFINELGREITAGVELGNGPDKYARLYLYGPDSGIDSYTTWVELAQIYSVLHEVFESALAPDGWVLLVEAIITGWAFAHDIDGATRNDLFERIRRALAAAPPAPSGEGVE